MEGVDSQSPEKFVRWAHIDIAVSLIDCNIKREVADSESDRAPWM